MHIVKYEKTLAYRSPSKAKLWHPHRNKGVTPRDVSLHSTITRWWLGECGHEWENPPTNQYKAKVDCPYCANKRVLAGFNDVGSHPLLLQEWHPTRNGTTDPTTVLISTMKLYWWLGTCGHEWEKSPYLRAKGERNKDCPYCATHNPRLLKGFNDLQAKFPQVAALWHPTLNGDLTPEDVMPYSNNKAWWLCENGHPLETTIYKMTHGSGCRICANRELLVGFNDLTTTHPQLAAQWHPTLNGDLSPEDVMGGADKVVWWQCSAKAHHEWKASLGDRTRVATGGTHCPSCAYSRTTSQDEEELVEIIKVLVPDALVETSVRSVIQGEIDIYIPSHNLAIEFNGVYWHSEEMGKDQKYHLRKTKEATALGIHLIHVWEDDWRERRDIVVRALAHRLGATERLNKPGALLVTDESLTRRYGARTLMPEVLSYNESSAFLEANHIQGKSTGTVHTGLRDKSGTLRAVFVTKRSGNEGHEGEWTIERYATRGIVPGGFTKLMKFTERQIKEQNLDAITQWVTFSDTSLSDGGLYRNYGFIEDRLIKPDYMYARRYQRVHKFNYRLKRFREDPDLKFEPSLTERELAQLNGLNRVWDSGKIRWTRPVE